MSITVLRDAKMVESVHKGRFVLWLIGLLLPAAVMLAQGLLYRMSSNIRLLGGLEISFGIGFLLCLFAVLTSGLSRGKIVCAVCATVALLLCQLVLLVVCSFFVLPSSGLEGVR